MGNPKGRGICAVAASDGLTVASCECTRGARDATLFAALLATSQNPLVAADPNQVEKGSSVWERQPENILRWYYTWLPERNVARGNGPR